MPDIVCRLISHVDDNNFPLIHQLFKLGSRNATHAVVRLLLRGKHGRRRRHGRYNSLEVRVVIRIAGGERYASQKQKDDGSHIKGLCLWKSLCHKRRQGRHNSRRRNTQYRTRRVSYNSFNLRTQHLIVAEQRTVNSSAQHDQVRFDLRSELDDLLVRPAFNDVRRDS